MSHEQLEVLSNQAVAACAVVYFMAVLAHLAQWAAGRQVPVSEHVEEHASVPVTVGGGARVTRTSRSDGAAVHEESERMQLFRRYSLSWLSPVVTGFVLVTLMVDVLVLYTPVVPRRDALQSPWLVIHVVAAIIATGAFTLGGMCSALYLVKERWERRQPPSSTDDSSTATGGYLARLPALAVLDRVAYRTHAFAFPIWTFAALIAGPIWAHYAWGRYWGWDPKEVWAFITWVVYAAYLHARATSGWKGRSAAVVALIGLLTLWFNFVGINFFFGSGSQHSYAAPEINPTIHAPLVPGGATA